ncbi:MAG: DUF1501 domain-containing protein [Bordetella sp.]|uniref:DUF1501 domain-containing protein n=1 Tax=Bordetella sp. TaxID=28081 RepID=UPI003F7B965D
MNRRHFLRAGAASLGIAALRPALASAANRSPDYARLLILVELKGGNDGLNTVIPYAAPRYAQLRPTIGIARDQVIALDGQTGLHPSMQALMPLWQQRELAVVQGVSYPSPNLSHFRSIEIWNTASASNQYLDSGWLARSFQQHPVPQSFASDAVVIGSAEMGPLANGAHAIALINPQQFLRDSNLVHPVDISGVNPELAHVLEVEHEIQRAADRLRPTNGQAMLRTSFPPGNFGNLVKTAMQIVADSETRTEQRVPGKGVAAIRLTLNGFDTHHDQPARHQSLLKQFSEGMAAMREALVEMNRWNSTLVMTYSEFGRRAGENDSRGTDHGTVAPHFIAGGAVRGGLYGVPPALDRLDGNGNLPVGVDFRSVYATVLEHWWGIDSRPVLNQRFPLLPLLRV